MAVTRRRVAEGDNEKKEKDQEREEEESDDDEESSVQEPPKWDHKLGAGFSSDLGRGLFRRLLHWGPLIALFLIFYIGITATWLSLNWWPIDTVGGFIHLFVFLLWNCLTFVNMLTASYIGGGFLPLEWTPDIEKADKRLQWCSQCKGYKAPRAHHCSKCGRCVMKMDHHCPWINNCVGHRNHRHFTFFLLFACVGCVHACVIIASSLYHAVHLNWYIKYSKDQDFPIVQVTLYSFLSSVLACAFAGGVAVAVGVLLYIQLKEISRNKTALEDYIVGKAESSREHNESLAPFTYPYDLGTMRNFKEVFGEGASRLNGVWWPVVKGCTQFSLTEEQLRQKKEKEKRARLVQITRDYKGGWWRAACVGPKTFFCQPLTEEARVEIKEKERWIVTRGSKQWLYGRREGEGEHDVKGWFPRSYAVLVEEDNTREEEEE